jgi:hypothetical protein
LEEDPETGRILPNSFNENRHRATGGNSFGRSEMPGSPEVLAVEL